MTKHDDFDLYEKDFDEWLRRGRKSFGLKVMDDDHPGRLDNMRDGERWG